MALHGSETGTNVHIVYAWEYADAAARTAATGMVPADVGKLARQLDTNGLWMLTDDSPVTWVGPGVSGSGGAYVPGGTDVAIADGGTGSSTAGAARTALGLAIGSDIQAWDVLLDLLAALADPNNDRILFWDDSAGALAWLEAGTGLSIAGTVLTAPGGGGAISIIGPHASFDGGGSAITTSVSKPIAGPAPVAVTITGWHIDADVSTTSVVDVQRATAAAPETFASIAGTNKPTLTADKSADDTTLTGWGDTTLDLGDRIRFVIDSNNNATWIGVSLTVTRAV